MFLGTHSSAGKSLLTTAFCRLLARRGVRVAPFKAQNMSNNAGVTPEGGEMGRAQIVQAEAAGIVPHTDMNPVLLKPEGDRRSQIVLNGQVHGHIDARNWQDLKGMLWQEVQAAYDRLASRYEVVLLEGAGSPAEINLKGSDIVNLRMARYAKAPCLLIGDIVRGGVFAALAGTMLLLEPEERRQVRGFLINKFRGDPILLGDGLQVLQEKAYGVPTLGVIPFLPNLRIAAEDAVALDRSAERDEAEPRVSGATIAALSLIDIAVVHLPHISNFDDFDPLAAEPGVRVRYVERAEELGQPRAVILPGTKVTMADLAWLRDRGLDRAIADACTAGAVVVGICGGYQMLGQTLADPLGVEGAPGSNTPGLGLLPVVTRLGANKQTHQARLRLPNGQVLTGYEIHVGETTLLSGAVRLGDLIERSGQPAHEPDGATSIDGRIWGTYLHGIFANDAYRRHWLGSLGWQGGAASAANLREAEYDRLADAVEAAVDWPRIAQIAGLEAYR
ncbi:MAG: cobyric acid synthase [Candidatus Latescibacteria bacterium]|nr:cobyric acid synthase [Candidatus Latescibacterota bacterium]